jgi:hypothetical protein
MWSASCPVLGNGPMNTRSDTGYVFSMDSGPRLCNASLFVARVIGELDLGAQK